MCLLKQIIGNTKIKSGFAIQPTLKSQVSKYLNLSLSNARKVFIYLSI